MTNSKKNIKYLELYYQLDHQRVAIEFDLTQKQILTYKIQLNDLPYQIASDGMITAYFMPFSDISKIKLFNFENSTSSMLGPNTDSQTIEYNAVHSLLPDSKLKITLKPD